MPLLLDEPTSNLDWERQEPLLAAVVGVARQHGLACVFVTHRPSLVRLADEHWRVAAGRVRIESIGRSVALVPGHSTAGVGAE